MLAQREPYVLRERIGNVVCGWDPLQFDFLVDDQVAYPMVPNTDVFGAALNHVVISEGDRRFIIAEHGRSILLVTEFA